MSSFPSNPVWCCTEEDGRGRRLTEATNRLIFSNCGAISFFLPPLGLCQRESKIQGKDGVCSSRNQPPEPKQGFYATAQSDSKANEVFCSGR